jgi:hypothetical protein
MAENLFANRLIGFDPVAERQRAREAEMRLMSSMSSNPYASIGYSLGSILGSGVKKLFNIEDASTTRVSDVQGALSQAASVFTPGSPDYFKDLAKRLEKYPDAKAIALEEAAKAEAASEKSFRETQKFVGDFPEALAGEAQKVQNTVLARLQRAGVNVETDPVTGQLLTPIPPEVLAQVEQLPEVQRLNQLTQIATRSSVKEAAETETKVMDVKKSELQLKKYESDLRKAQREENEESRVDTETIAARNFLKGANIDPNRPLEGQIPAAVLYGPAGTAYVRAMQDALRTTEKERRSGGRTPTPAAKPSTADTSLKASVERSGIAFEPNKYDYRVLPNGQVQRKLKQ